MFILITIGIFILIILLIRNNKKITNLPDKNPNDFSKTSSSTEWKVVDFHCENCNNEAPTIYKDRWFQTADFCHCGAHKDTFKINEYAKRLIVKNNKWVPQYRKIKP